jgi:hypothetical protein
MQVIENMVGERGFEPPTPGAETKKICQRVDFSLRGDRPGPRRFIDRMLGYSYSTLVLRQGLTETERKRQAWQTEGSRFVGGAHIGNERKSGG